MESSQELARIIPHREGDESGLSDLAQEALNYLDRLQEGDIDQISFGWGKRVDEATMGLEAENLIIVGGDFKAGKTTFAVNTVAEAIQRDTPCLVITTEVSRMQYLYRLVSRETHIPLRQMRTPGALTVEQIDAVRTTIRKLDEAPITIVEKPLCTVGEIEDAIYRYSPAVVVVDHLQRLDLEHDNLMLGSKYATLRLKNMAVANRIPVVLLSQVTFDEGWHDNGTYDLSRMKTRWGKEPLGEGDKILFLHNLERAGKPGRANVIIHSQRDYEAGDVIEVCTRYAHQWVGDHAAYDKRYGMAGPY